MSEAREDALMGLYRAFNTRDMDGLLANLAPDVDWPNGWEGGREHGRDAVRDYWTRQWKAIDPRVEPTAIETDPDGKVHVRVHQVVMSKDGKVLDDSRLEHVYEFEGPFVKRMTIVKAPPDDEEDED
jgi:ketosteroid isomerase-like protein